MALNLAAWERCGTVPEPRAGCAVGAEGDGIVVVGGTRWEDGRKLWCARTDRFAPATGAWEALAPLPQLLALQGMQQLPGAQRGQHQQHGIGVVGAGGLDRP